MGIKITQDELVAAQRDAFDNARSFLLEEPMPAGCINVRGWASRYGLSRDRADKELRKLEFRGILGSEMVTFHGRRVRFYRPIEVAQCPESKPLTSGPNGKKRRISG